MPIPTRHLCGIPLKRQNMLWENLRMRPLRPETWHLCGRLPSQENKWEQGKQGRDPNEGQPLCPKR